MMSKKKKDYDGKPWLILCLLSLLFYGSLLLLTLFAKDIHNARLPHVTTARPSKQKFTYTVTWEGSTMERSGSYTALPKDMVDTGKVFILRTVAESDFTYYYAQQISVVADTTKEHADYYAISSGISNWDTIIMTGYETLEDGDEVYLITEEKKEQKKEDLSAEDLFQ